MSKYTFDGPTEGWVSSMREANNDVTSTVTLCDEMERSGPTLRADEWFNLVICISAVARHLHRDIKMQAHRDKVAVIRTDRRKKERCYAVR